jgi:ACS family tartrate transporter-like MFS transporter
LPLIIVIYFVAYIDRTNVGFAALTMNKDLGLSAYVFGWGAGIFFLGYFLFEVPSNVILEKVGARVWIARIMITWGIVSGAMALVQGPVSFIVMRFLLGVAEAGFFPGMILYFTYWFPKAYRARVISALFIAVPGSNALAAVFSGAILDMDGILGLAGWQWMFIVEAVPAVLLAFVVLAMMTDRPALAAWLAPEEREWLETRLQDERRRIESAGHLSLARALMDRRVLALSAIYLTIVTATYGITFFLPQIVKGIGLSNVMTGLVTAIPYTVGTIGMLLWGASSDRRDERRCRPRSSPARPLPAVSRWSTRLATSAAMSAHSSSAGSRMPPGALKPDSTSLRPALSYPASSRTLPCSRRNERAHRPAWRPLRAEAIRSMWLEDHFGSDC